MDEGLPMSRREGALFRSDHQRRHILRRGKSRKGKQQGLAALVPILITVESGGDHPHRGPGEGRALSAADGTMAAGRAEREPEKQPGEGVKNG